MKLQSLRSTSTPPGLAEGGDERGAQLGGRALIELPRHADRVERAAGFSADFEWGGQAQTILVISGGDPDGTLTPAAVLLAAAPLRRCLRGLRRLRSWRPGPAGGLADNATGRSPACSTLGACIAADIALSNESAAIVGTFVAAPFFAAMLAGPLVTAGVRCWRSAAALRARSGTRTPARPSRSCG